MPFYQRDIVKVKLKLPDGSEKTHPYLIISCEDANSRESDRTYLGVMVTHSQSRDKFSISIKKEMMETHWDDSPAQQIRTTIFGYFTDKNISRDITHHVGRMKKIHFENILGQVKDFVFKLDK